MARVALPTVFILMLACGRPPTPVPSASTAAPTPSASASAVASASAAPPIAAPIDAGAFAEDTTAFEGATVTPLPVELLPDDQRKREDGKDGFVRVARVDHAKDAGLATFGLLTKIDSSGARLTNQWFTRPASATHLGHASGAAVAYAMYDARFSPAPVPALLVLEDAAREPIAVRFEGVIGDLREETLFDGAPAFFVRRYEEHAWGFDDRVDLDVVAWVDGELRLALSVYLGFRDVDGCPNGKGHKTTGPPGSVTIVTRGTRPVLRVREAASDCDNPVKVTSGCAGTARDYAWEAAKHAFVPESAGTKVTLSSKPSGC